MKKILFILSIFISRILFAQELQVSINKNPAIVGEQILVQYTIDEKGTNFTSPSFKGLKIISGPNPSTSSSYTFINGKSESKTTTTYSFYIKAIKEGVFNITPASIQVKGEMINSKSLQLKIIKGNERTKGEQKAISENLYIKVDVSKKNIVVGEQILVAYKLVTRLDLHNTELSELPALNGFWAKDLETSSRFKRNVINGVAYNVATIKKSVLTAQKSGKLTIDPMELKCSIKIQKETRNRDPFANFFGGGYSIKDEFIKSKAITINVSELPPSPSNFNGAVGNMNITSEVDNHNINADDAVTYKLSVIGTGNIELIKPLNIKFPEEFEVYDPKISDRIFEGGRKRSVKTFEYLLIPRYKGNYTIPSASLLIYNTKTKKYEEKKSKQHYLTINPSINNENENTNIKQQIIHTEKRDINYIALESELQKMSNNVINKNLFYILFFFPFFLIIALWIYNLFYKKNNTEGKTRNKKKANKIALKRLKNAQKCINNNDFDSFFEETEKSLWGYFADKFKVNVADLSKETISNYFNSNTIKNELESEFIALLDECEFARYSPSNNKNIQMDEILNKAKNIIIKVETSLK